MFLSQHLQRLRKIATFDFSGARLVMVVAVAGIASAGLADERNEWRNAPNQGTKITNDGPSAPQTQYAPRSSSNVPGSTYNAQPALNNAVSTALAIGAMNAQQAQQQQAAMQRLQQQQSQQNAAIALQRRQADEQMRMATKNVFAVNNPQSNSNPFVGPALKPSEVVYPPVPDILIEVLKELVCSAPGVPFGTCEALDAENARNTAVAKKAVLVMRYCGTGNFIRAKQLLQMGEALNAPVCAAALDIK